MEAILRALQISEPKMKLFIIKCLASQHKSFLASTDVLVELTNKHGRLIQIKKKLAWQNAFVLTTPTDHHKAKMRWRRAAVAHH